MRKAAWSGGYNAGMKDGIDDTADACGSYGGPAHERLLKENGPE